MWEFTMEIAQTPAAVCCRFGSTQEYFKAYLTHRRPELTVSVSPEDLILEQQLLNEEADREGLRRRVFTEPFLERAVIQRKISAFLLHRKVLLLHGSTVAVDGKAYLFTAKTGVGKSTHTRLWREVFTHRAIMVNDDRTFLHIHPDGTFAFGSPWSGKHGLDTNVCVPLAGICVLERGTENRIRPISPEEALPMLLDQAYLPDESGNQALRELTTALAANLPLWQMACTKDPRAAELAYAAMSGREVC